MLNTTAEGRFLYTSLVGFFSPSVSSALPEDYDYVTQNLGLLETSYDTDPGFDPKRVRTQWERFKYYVEHLNALAGPGVSYKVLYLSRHGEGVHNVAERTYGTKMWEAYWAKLEGNGTVCWADALLTDTGIKQTKAANEFWGRALSGGPPPPDRFYSSPLRRCLQTAYLSFSGLPLPQDKPLRPIVKELLREILGRHTCDRRSSRSEIDSFLASLAPDTFVFEPGFAAHDDLWDPETRESDGETQARLRTVLDDIFEHEPGTWVSVTSHSGAIRALLAVVGHRLFQLDQGSTMAVVIKAEKLGGC